MPLLDKTHSNSNSYLRCMAKWILWLGFLLGIMSCQSETTTNSPQNTSLPPKSGTTAPPSRAAVPLIFFLKEAEISNNSSQHSIKNPLLFHSLPAGVYSIQGDSIVFGAPPMEWISSGSTRWPLDGRVALADLIISDNPLFSDQIGIFPQKPGKDGYLPGCFSCPRWMNQKYGELAVFWEKFRKE